MRRKTVSITDSTVATYAFDDRADADQREDWNQHGDVGIQRGVGGWFNECVCGVNEWCEQQREWVHGEWIDGDVDVGYGCAAW